VMPFTLHVQMTIRSPAAVCVAGSMATAIMAQLDQVDKLSERSNSVALIEQPFTSMANADVNDQSPFAIIQRYLTLVSAACYNAHLHDPIRV
jgi:hypothetical protein